MAQVSVVIPVYNVERYLDRCVQSVLNQTLKDIEIILVDDGSPDNCPQMCDDYARRYDNIKVVHKTNAGLGMACNSGMDVATGKYIAFLDSDDWVDPDMYETMLRDAEANNAQMVFTGLKRVGSDGADMGKMAHPSNMRVIQKSEIPDLVADMICGKADDRYDHSIQVSAKVVLYRLSMLRDSGVRFVSEREYPSEDLIFNVSALLHAQCVVVIPRFFYNYFVNTSSISQTVRKDQFGRTQKTSKKLADITSAAGLDCQQRIDRFTIANGRWLAGTIAKSSLPFCEKLHELRKITEFDIWEDINSRYPVTLMPLKHKILFKLLAGKHYCMMFILCKFAK